MRGRQVLMESLIAQGVELHLRQSRHDREPHHRQPARLPAAQLHRGPPRGGGRGRGELLRAGQRQDGRRERPRGARARQRHRHDVQRAEGGRADRRHRRAAGHAHASPRSSARARSRGHGGPGDEVERPGRASRRAAPAPASRVQGGERSARRPGVRGPAHRRDGAGDRESPWPPARCTRGRARPAGVRPRPRLLLGSRQPRHRRGDDVARCGAQPRSWRWPRRWAPRCGSRACGTRRVPNNHPNFRGALGFDAPSIRKALDGADAVLLVGGPFFEEVWFSPGSPFPTDAAVIQIEASPERLAYNFPLTVGLIGHPAPRSRARWRM